MDSSTPTSLGSFCRSRPTWSIFRWLRSSGTDYPLPHDIQRRQRCRPAASASLAQARSVAAAMTQTGGFWHRAAAAAEPEEIFAADLQIARRARSARR